MSCRASLCLDGTHAALPNPPARDSRSIQDILRGLEIGGPRTLDKRLECALISPLAVRRWVDRVGLLRTAEAGSGHEHAHTWAWKARLIVGYRARDLGGGVVLLVDLVGMPTRRAGSVLQMWRILQ